MQLLPRYFLKETQTNASESLAVALPVVDIEKKYFQVLKKTTQTRIKNEEREKKKKRKTTLDKWSQETCRSVCTCRVAQMVTDDYTVKPFRK